MTTSDDPSPVESGVLAKANRLLRLFSARSDGSILPLRKPRDPPTQPAQGANEPGRAADTVHPATDGGTTGSSEKAHPVNESHHAAGTPDGGRPGSPRADEGSVVGGGPDKPRPNIATRFYRTVRAILLHSWVNVLLVFVPAGIVVQAIPGVHVGVVFAVNCVAIVPLAGLLSHATESVASNLGDTIGALLNVTFGNAVELIIL